MGHLEADVSRTRQPDVKVKKYLFFFHLDPVFIIATYRPKQFLSAHVSNHFLNPVRTATFFFTGIICFSHPPPSHHETNNSPDLVDFSPVLVFIASDLSASNYSVPCWTKIWHVEFHEYKLACQIALNNYTALLTNNHLAWAQQVRLVTFSELLLVKFWELLCVGGCLSTARTSNRFVKMLGCNLFSRDIIDEELSNHEINY